MSKYCLTVGDNRLLKSHSNKCCKKMLLKQYLKYTNITSNI